MFTCHVMIKTCQVKQEEETPPPAAQLSQGADPIGWLCVIVLNGDQ